jgi:hypothetical protein
MLKSLGTLQVVRKPKTWKHHASPAVEARKVQKMHEAPLFRVQSSGRNFMATIPQTHFRIS